MEKHYVLWACYDCTQEYHTGDDIPFSDHSDHVHYPREVTGEITAGCLPEDVGCEHDLSNDYDMERHAEECEYDYFSKKPCDFCGCTLWGERSAFTEWLPSAACINCGAGIHEDANGSWIDETGGDGCLQESPDNQVHHP